MVVAVNPITQQLVDASQQQGVATPDSALPVSATTSQMIAPQTGSPLDAVNQFIVGKHRQAAEQAAQAKAENDKQAKLAASTAWYKKQISNPNSKQGKFLRDTYGTDLEKLIRTGVIDITSMQNEYAKHQISLAKGSAADKKEANRLMKLAEQMFIARPELDTPEIRRAIALDPRNTIEMLGLAKQDLTSNKGISSKAIQTRAGFDRAWSAKGLDLKLDHMAERYITPEIRQNPDAVASIKQRVKDTVYEQAKHSTGMLDLFAITEQVVADENKNFASNSGFGTDNNGNLLDFANPSPELQDKIDAYTNMIEFNDNLPHAQARESAIERIKAETDLGAKEEYGTFSQNVTAPILGAANTGGEFLRNLGSDIKDYFSN